MQLPDSTKVNKFVAKTKFFSSTKLNSKLKDDFAKKIEKITWSYKLSEKTLGIEKTENVEEIQIFTLELKKKEIPTNILKLIDESIPYPILYIFKYDGSFSYGIFSSQKLYTSDWDEKLSFDFNGLNLERVYENIVIKFIKDIDKDNKDFRQIVEQDDIIKSLKKEIQILQNKINREKQFKNKLPLHKELNLKEEELNNLLNK